LNVLSIILLTACLLNGYLAAVSFRFRKAPGATTFGFFLLTIVLYSLGYAFEIHSTSLPEILFWLKIEYLGISFFPTLLLIYTFQYIGMDNWLKPWFLVTIFTISSLTMIIHLTNGYTHWFYKETSVDISGSLVLIKAVKGFWYWVHQGYSIASMGTFNTLFFIMYLREDQMKRRQALIVLLSSLAPWICYIIYITGNSPHDFDLIPFSFLLMGLLTGWGMLKYRLFHLEPLALGNIFECMADGVIILNHQGNIVSYNKAAQGVFDSLTKENINKPFSRLAEVYPELHNLQENDVTVNKDLEIGTGDTHHHYDVKPSIVYNRTGQPVGRTLIFRDITDRKHTEQLLLNNQDRLTKLNKTKDKLFSIIGHDLRGPMGNIYNLATIINESFDRQSDEDRKRIIKTLCNSSEQSLKLIENLLVWAKSQTGGIQFTPQQFRLNSVVKETLDVLKPIALEKKVSIENTVCPEIGVYADAQMISLVIRNLVANAIKYTRREGLISVKAIPSDLEIVVEIEDNGIGIPEEIIRNLFSIDRSIRRNGTENEPGTGLGLLLCKEFIDQHKGQIGVKKSSEAGTVFYFTIPSHS